jgi:ABC-type sugar transport system ATPase subunit
VGELQQFASPDELYRRPASAFVAGFVGHPPMNLLRGTFEDGHFGSGGLRLPIQGPAQGAGFLGIRPEDARLGGDIPARVVVVEPLGREALVTLSAGGVDLKVLITEDRRPAVGSNVGFGYDPDRLHLFDAEGRRL